MLLNRLLKKVFDKAPNMVPRPNEFGLPGKVYRFGNRVVINGVVYDAECLRRQKANIEQFRKRHPHVHTLLSQTVAYNQCIVGRMKMQEHCKMDKNGVIVCSKEGVFDTLGRNDKVVIMSKGKEIKVSSKTRQNSESITTKRQPSAKKQTNVKKLDTKHSIIKENLIDKKFLLGAGAAVLVMLLAMNK